MLRRELAPISAAPTEGHPARSVDLAPAGADGSPIRRYDDVCPARAGRRDGAHGHALRRCADRAADRPHVSGARRPVLFDVTEGSRTSRPPAVLCTGTLGSGKTLTAQLLALHAFVGGSRWSTSIPRATIACRGDRRGPRRTHRATRPTSATAGLLDPLRIAPEDLRVELAHSFLTELLPAPVPARGRPRSAPRSPTSSRPAAEAPASCSTVASRRRGRASRGSRAGRPRGSPACLQLGFASRRAATRRSRERPRGQPAHRQPHAARAGHPERRPDAGGAHRPSAPAVARGSGPAPCRARTGRATRSWSSRRRRSWSATPSGSALVGRIVRLCRSQNATPILRHPGGRRRRRRQRPRRLLLRLRRRDGARGRARARAPWPRCVRRPRSPRAAAQRSVAAAA